MAATTSKDFGLRFCRFAFARPLYSVWRAVDLLVRVESTGEYERHLPMLAEAGVITYDTTQGVVGRGQAFRTVVSLLEVTDTRRENASMGQS